MTAIFVNIPTTDLERAKAFYTALGARIDPHFTDENAASLRWSEEIWFMVLTREFFATMTDKQVADPATTVSSLIALSRDSRAEVDRVIEAGVAAGGTELGQAQDHGFMYARDLADPDGNGLELLWMDPVAAREGPGRQEGP